MSKAIDKNYLLDQLENFNDEIIAEYYVDNATFLDFASGVDSALNDKINKVSSATSGNFAGLDSNGNLTDSGKKPSDFIEKSSTTGLVKNDGTIDTSTYPNTFTGTQAQWNALTTAQKKEYEICNITDDIGTEVFYTKAESDATFATKVLSEPIEGQSTVEGALGALSSNKVGWDGLGTIYSFHVSSTESNPANKITYIGDTEGMTPVHMDYANDAFDWGSWRDAFFLPRPCMVRSDGTVDYYLDPNDYTKRMDGTASDVGNIAYDGNAMMEWGRNGRKIWTKIVPDNDHLGADVFIADYQADSGFHDYSFHNCNGVSVDHFYTPIYNGSLDSNNKLRSMSGQQVMNKKTAENEKTYAQANNKTEDVIWNTEVFADITLINLLLMLIGKSTNVQSIFGQGLNTGGTEAINNAFRTGVHNTKGLFYGTNSGIVTSNDFSNAVKVFGMENWWGFQWRRYQGHVMVDGVQKVKMTYGTEDGSTVVGYNYTGDGYKSTGATALSGTSGNYIKDEYYTEDGLVPCGELSASDTTYYCDACWFNNSGVLVPCRGGSSSSGAKGGAFSVYMNNTASYPNWVIGAALSCKPLATPDISTKADNTVIAPVEDGTTIQNPSGYAVDSHAIRNGAFITWKNAKAQGETINDASDYDSGDVASAIDTINIGAANTPHTNITLDIRNNVFKNNKLVIARVQFAVTTALTGDYTNAFNSPYAPINNCYINFQLIDVDNNVVVNNRVGITSAGSVRIYGDLAVGNYQIVGTYLTN